jgi:hypothetical protein
MYIDNMYFYSAGSDIPSNVTITASGEAVTISWTAVPGAVSYTVYAADNPAGPFVPVVGGIYNGTSWTSDGTMSKKFYYVTATSN